MHSTNKTKYMLAIYNSVKFEPPFPNPPGVSLLFFVERELLPILDWVPTVIDLLSPQVQDLIIRHHTQRFVRAALSFPAKVGSWEIAMAMTAMIKKAPPDSTLYSLVGQQVISQQGFV